MKKGAKKQKKPTKREIEKPKETKGMIEVVSISSPEEFEAFVEFLLHFTKTIPIGYPH